MITDFDDAYSNAAYINGGASYPAKWANQASSFRANLPPGCTAKFDVPYGSRVRNKLDLFEPADKSHGIAIFVHGGYWMKFSKDDWSHLARGALLRNWVVALPNYTLAPEARIADIVVEIRNAIIWLAQRYSGPIRLAGHSAGGHLVTRTICTDSNIDEEVLERVKHVLSISGVHDLRPLLQTKLNQTLLLTNNEATSQSPALCNTMSRIPLTCWVGADERPEFIRQSELLANIWYGLGHTCTKIQQSGRHHFNIVDDLGNQDSDLTKIFAP